MRSMLDGSPDGSTRRGRAVQWTIFLGATAAAVYLCLLILRPFFTVIAWSVVLAIAFYPVHRRLERRTGRLSLSAFITSTLVVLAVVVPLVLIAGIAVNQLQALGDSLHEAFSDQGGAAGRAAAAFTSLTRRLGLGDDAIRAWASQHAGELARGAGQYTLSIAATLTGAIVSFFFMVFAMFLLLRDGAGMVARIPDLLPIERAQTEALFLRIRTVVYGSVYGILVIAAIQGALCAGMFKVLGIPSAALWGMVTMFASVLPLVGTAAVWIPGALYLALEGQWTQSIVLAIWGAAVVSSVDNVLRPRLVGDRVGLSELATFFALLGGLRVFGVLGIVLGPVIFATAGALIGILSEANRSPAARARATSDEVL